MLDSACALVRDKLCVGRRAVEGDFEVASVQRAVAAFMHHILRQAIFRDDTEQLRSSSRADGTANQALGDCCNRTRFKHCIQAQPEASKCALELDVGGVAPRLRRREADHVAAVAASLHARLNLLLSLRMITSHTQVSY